MNLMFRHLARAPGLAVTSLLVVALGIGAATAIFSIVNALILRPIALPEPERLVVVYETHLARNQAFFAVSARNYVDWKERSTSWESLGAIGARAMNLTGGAEPTLENVVMLSANFLPTLGLEPLLGRGFQPEEDEPGRNQVALLSASYWRSRYNADPSVLGRTLTLDGTPHTIVGVVELPPLQPWDNIMIPLAPDQGAERSHHDILVYGRLKPGISLEQADTELKAVAAQILSENPGEEQGWSTRLVPLGEDVVGTGLRLVLQVLMGAVALLLLIACANLSNLMLIRATARAHELSIRTALGATRRDLVRNLLGESLVVTLGGGVFGVVLALWAVDALRRAPLPRAAEIDLDWRVLAVALVMSIGTGLLAGVGPALRASQAAPEGVLKGRAPRSGHRSRLRDVTVVTQMALSLALLVAAALLTRSFWKLSQVDPGFRPDGVFTVALRPNTDNPVPFYDQVVDRVATLPHVASVGLISRLPLTDGGTSLNVFPVGPSLLPAEASIQANWRLIHGDYFATMHIPLLHGTDFAALTPDEAARSIIVSPTLSRALWGDGDPLGRQVNLGNGHNPLTVIGVAGDVRSHRLSVAPNPSYYLSIHRFTYGPLALVVRMTSAGEADGGTAALIPALRHAIQQIDPTVPLFQVRTMNELRAESLQQERLVIGLLGGFALSALLLATLGTYGVVTFMVQQRTAEIGIRVAVGAQPRDILQLVLGHGARLVVWGLALGLVGSLAAARVLRALLYETPATDHFAYLAGALALGGAVLVASSLPAWRATRVDPVQALRSD